VLENTEGTIKNGHKTKTGNQKCTQDEDGKSKMDTRRRRAIKNVHKTKTGNQKWTQDEDGQSKMYTRRRQKTKKTPQYVLDKQTNTNNINKT
jgi:hypothetical protein